MNVKVKKSIIQEKLSKIQNIVEKKSIMPVLNHFLLTASESGAFILATDLETAVKQPVEIEVLEPGSACIPAKKFYEIIRELEEEIELTLIEGWLKIQSGRSIFKLATLKPDEFPVWPEIGTIKKLEFTRDFLLTAIEKTIYAAGESDARFVLNGVLFHIKEPNYFRVVGTDGHRLAMFTAHIDTTQPIEGEKQVILSKKSLNELRKFLADTESVNFYIGRTHVMFEMDGISFLTRMIEGAYPDYEKVIPKNNPLVAVVDKNLTIASLKRVSTLSKEHYNAVKIEFKEDLLTISATDPELGEAQDELSIDYQYEPFQIAFNARYLIEALSALSSDRAKITMSNSESAAYITDAEQKVQEFKGSGVYEAVVMPLRL